MHKTTAQWEAGVSPSPELIARVGALLGELTKAGVFEAGEGLRPTADGVRLKFSGGARTTINGPFAGDHELPAAFSILRVTSLDEAIEWATRQAAALGDVEFDIRPVTEPWDIGMRPPPEHVTTRRYMVLRKATAATESDAAPTPPQRAELSRLIDEATHTGRHLVTENMTPSRRGRRYMNTRDGVTVYDGPFIESKELIAGYVVISGDSLEDVDRWARRYVDAVGASEVDVRELE